MKIVIADSLTSAAIERLREGGWIVDARSGRTSAALAADMSDADALIVRSATRVDRTLLGSAPKLRVVARAGSGVDNVDVDAATARGIVVMNAPGVNSVSVAEHALALILSLARRIPAADASMKATHWDKSKFTGGELRSKVLGIVGLGRVGQEVASRARAFGMEVIAHDPFISTQVASDLGVELVSLEDLCRRSDHITLHVPSTQATRRLFDADRLAHCKKGVRLINTARGDLIDENALFEAIESGQVGGAALDVFESEPPRDWRLTSLPQVIATPHIAAATREALELVSMDTANAVRDFLREGVIRNAVNFPSVSLEEYRRLRPYLMLAERLGSVAAQMGEARTQGVGVRYYGDLAAENGQLLGSAVLIGLLRAMLSSGVTPVNARSVASRRGIELIESRSSRPRNFTNLISVKLLTSAGERWVEGTAFDNGSLRLVLVNGVAVEAPLEGTMLIIANRDQPGVIGEVGSLLGRHGVNIANFALGRSAEGAVGVVNVDEIANGGESGVINSTVLGEIRAVPAVRAAWLIRL